MAVDCAHVFASPLMQQIIRVESSGNPFAIGVVGNALKRQPVNESEAIVTAKMLDARGFNYSIGIGQVNKVHFARLGWDSELFKGFNYCQNVLAANDIFFNCRAKAIKAGYSVYSDITTIDGVKASAADAAALSCYYSGDLRAGTKLGYTARVLRTGTVPITVVRGGKSAGEETSMMAE